MTIKSEKISTNTQTAYTEVAIRQHFAGFEMFTRGEIDFSSGNAWAFLSDLEMEIAQNGIEFLPIEEALQDPRYQAAGVEDIRGRIEGGDPDYLYARLDHDPDMGLEVAYFGVESAEVAEDLWQS